MPNTLVSSLPNVSIPPSLQLSQLASTWQQPDSDGPLGQYWRLIQSALQRLPSLSQQQHVARSTLRLLAALRRAAAGQPTGWVQASSLLAVCLLPLHGAVHMDASAVAGVLGNQAAATAQDVLLLFRAADQIGADAR